MAHSKEALYLWVGDLHVGAPGALTLASEASNPRQRWLSARWSELLKLVKVRAKGRALRLMLGGDLTDLPDIKDATEIAVELLRPLYMIADEVWGVYGTPYHVGEDGKEDSSVYGQLGAKDRRRSHHHWLMLPGGKLSWSHHGMRIGQDPHTELNGHRQIAERLYWRMLQRRRDPVRYVVRHHVHRTPDGSPITWRGTQVCVCPCWKFPDSFSGKFMPDAPMPTFGALIVDGAGPIEVITYEPPDSLDY